MALVSAFADQDLFSPFFNSWSGAVAPRSGGHDASTRGIPIDVMEKSDNFEIKADIPGVNKQDIKLHVDGDVLSIAVQKEEAKKDEKAAEGFKVLRTERSAMFVRRSLRLPQNADLGKVSANQVNDVAQAQVSAKYENGVLKVDVSKSDEKAKAKAIDVA